MKVVLKNLNKININIKLNHFYQISIYLALDFC